MGLWNRLHPHPSTGPALFATDPTLPNPVANSLLFSDVTPWKPFLFLPFFFFFLFSFLFFFFFLFFFPLPSSSLPSSLPSLFKDFIFSNLYTQHRALTHNLKSKNRVLSLLSQLLTPLFFLLKIGVYSHTLKVTFLKCAIQLFFIYARDCMTTITT